MFLLKWVVKNLVREMNKHHSEHRVHKNHSEKLLHENHSCQDANSQLGVFKIDHFVKRAARFSKCKNRKSQAAANCMTGGL
jgi:hypothetical protein